LSRLGLLPGFAPTFRFHEVDKNIIDARQVTFAFQFQPFQNAWIKSHAYRDLRSDVAQSHHFCQLFLSQARNLVVVDARMVARSLPCGNAAGSVKFSLRPAPGGARVRGTAGGELIGYETTWDRCSAELRRALPSAERRKVIIARSGRMRTAPQ
jgi:hypothetical protein